MVKINKKNILTTLTFLLLFFQGCSFKKNNISIEKKHFSFYNNYHYNYSNTPIIYQIFFPFNKYSLNKKEEKKLISILNSYKKNFDKKQNSYPIYISIESSCDYCGNKKYNKILGKKRILYVKKILQNVFKNRKIIFLNQLNLSKNFSIKCKEKKARFTLLVIDTNNEF